MEMNTARVILHNHTEYSVRDGAMSVRELVAAAKLLNAEAIALTDHGNMVGVYEFADACKEAEIKPIFGVEAYYCETPDNNEKSHLILMAKNDAGYRAVIKAVSDSWQNTYDDFPRMTRDILQTYFGAGSIGHGNVIATSACINGVIAAKLRENDVFQKEIAKTEKRRSALIEVNEVDVSKFLDMEYEIGELSETVKNESKIIKGLKTVAGMKLTGLEKRLKTLSGEEAQTLQEEISRKLSEKEAAERELSERKNRLTQIKRTLTERKKEYNKMEPKVTRLLAAEEKIELIKSQFLSDEQLYQNAAARAKEFVDIFGEDFYMEIQNHGLDTEKQIMPVMVKLAHQLNIPLVAANDAHYATNSADDIRRRDLLATMRYPDTVLDEQALLDAQGHGELYLKSDLELKVSLNRIVSFQDTEEAMRNVLTIADACSYVPEFCEHYPKYKFNGLETAADRLRRLAQEGIDKKYPGTWDEEKQKRLDYELDVIISQGYADYLCIVQDYLEYGRSLAQTEYPEKVGYTIGPGRGSAAGSLVCYLTGITSIDPLKYNLLFERFLNKDRVSMPDIDADFHTELRAKVVEYVKEKYGEKAVCGIITKTRMAGRGAVRNVGRITEVPAGLTDTVARTILAIPNAKISDGGSALQEMCNNNQAVAKLISDAKLVEGRMSAYGAHAAGIIISDNDDVGDYIPLMQGETGTVAQCDMAQCEFNAGLLKMDFLGLRNLDIITDTLRRVYRNYGIRIDMESVPFEAEVFSQIFATGKTNSVFQFESGGMKSMLRQFKPDCFEDIILLVAAYRPGPMQFLEDIIATKHGYKKPSYICSGLENILKDTYGKPIYQEQVMQICNQVAGFTLGESDIIRRAMGKKKISILTDPKTNFQGRFIEGLITAGASNKDAEEYWNSLLDFASYAFNKSHAAAYALLSYYTAYLKYHYPAEYMCAVMMRTDIKKLPPLLSECKSMGMTVLAPDINRSDVDFSNDGNQILFGFNNIKGVGNSGNQIVAMRKKDGRFVSVRNFIYRIVSGKGQASSGVDKTAVTSIVNCGGFDSFCDGNRAAISAHLESLTDLAKKIKNKEADIELKKEALLVAGNEKEKKKAERQYNNAVESCKKLREEFNAFVMTAEPESKDVQLSREKELMGIYVSGHPLDDYEQNIKEEHTQEIATLENGRCSICGIISNLVFKTTKKDNKPIAFFTLSDKTGDCEIKCWSKEFELFSPLLTENNIVKIDGKSIIETSVDEDGNETVVGTSVHVRSMKALIKKDSRTILLSCKSIVDWQETLYERIKPYISESGCVCCLNDLLLREVRRCSFRISPEILKADIPGLECYEI